MLKFQLSTSALHGLSHALRTRYTELEINIEVGLEEKNREVFERVKDNMLNGSLLTYSLEEGMEVDYNLTIKAV